VGEIVGPYRIIAQLGQGGMATVYKAYHAALDRYVALEVLRPAFLEDTSFLARFQREARLVARLDQPNIVPIYGYAGHEGRPYRVMKFIEGETLKARNSFYYGDQGHAQDMLDQLMQDNPDLPEGQLLEAEFAAELGENDRAHQSLADLRKNPSARD